MMFNSFQRRYDQIKSQIINITNTLGQLDWNSYTTLRLKNIRDDIRSLKRKEEDLMRSNKRLLSQIDELSKQLEFYQSKEIVVDILHLDDELCIVNKPADVCIDGDDYVTLEKLTQNTLRRSVKLRNCHQLDRATSGVMVYALTKQAAGGVSRLFHTRSVIKMYHAIVYGHVASDHFFIDLPLWHSKYKTYIANHSQPGRAAITECVVLKRGYFTIKSDDDSKEDIHSKSDNAPNGPIPVSLVRVYLHTGRRHQIRIHLAQCSHPILGDLTYWKRSKIHGVRSTLRVLNSQCKRMYLDAHRMILQFPNNKKVDVSTHSSYSFAALIDDEYKSGGSNTNKSNAPTPESLFFPVPHSFAQFNYSMIIPFVMNNDRDDIQILIKKSTRIDMVNFRGQRPRSHHLKGLCWNFVAEAPLKLGHADAAQVISQEFMDQIPQSATYLFAESRFAPTDLTVVQAKDGTESFSESHSESKYESFAESAKSNEMAQSTECNPKYIAHHLASNIRRGAPYHCTVCCAPYVIFLVPFSKCFPLNDNTNLVWCSWTDLVDEMACYSPLHLVTVDDGDKSNDKSDATSLPMDPLLHFVISDERISSLQWIQQQRSERVTMSGDKATWIDIYGAKETPNLSVKVMDDEPCRVLEDTPLYVGSIKAAKNIKRLRELNVSHIVDCRAPEKALVDDGQFVRLCIPVTDTLDADIMQFMEECVEFIDGALNDNKAVLVHCWAGASRSVSVVIGYLMTHREMTLKQSLEHIQRVRGGFARPNTKFLMQLRGMERGIFGCNSFWISEKQLNRFRRKCSALN